MILNLSEIVTIRTGSPDLNEQSGEQLPIIRMKDVNHEIAEIDWGNTELVFTGTRPVKAVVNNDLLIVSKGERNTAVLVSGLTHKALATNHFFVLSVRDSMKAVVDPEYLVWFLNYPAKYDIESKATGAVIPTLRKETLANLEINVPSISDQKKTVEIYQTMIQQRKVFDQLFHDRMVLLCNHVSKFK